MRRMDFAASSRPGLTGNPILFVRCRADLIQCRSPILIILRTVDRSESREHKKDKTHFMVAEPGH